MRTVSGKRFCKALEEHGWTFQRINGAHHIYGQSGNPVIISVPVHGNRDMKPGTQRSLMRQAGLTDADL